MEPVALLIVAAGFAASQVAQKCADAAIEQAWRKMKAGFRRYLDRDPQPTDFPWRLAIDERDSGALELFSAAQEVFDRSASLGRVRFAGLVMRGASVLWIDDLPENNSWERAILRTVGTNVTSVETTCSAVACLKHESFDVIVSDIARGESNAAGLKAIPKIREQAPTTPLIFYVGTLDKAKSVPTGCSGITNDPEELLGLLLDVLTS